jgi:putative sterol carrier protein
MPLFGTPIWVQAYAEAVNENEAFVAAAQGWQSDFFFVINHPEGVEKSVKVYVDLIDGKCKVAELVQDPAPYTPEFEVIGTFDNWKKVITREINPLQAIMSGRLAIKGNIFKLMKQTAAAQELVNSISRVETQFLD